MRPKVTDHYLVSTLIGPCTEQEADDVADAVLDASSKMGGAVMLHPGDSLILSPADVEKVLEALETAARGSHDPWPFYGSCFCIYCQGLSLLGVQASEPAAEPRNQVSKKQCPIAGPCDGQCGLCEDNPVSVPQPTAPPCKTCGDREVVLGPHLVPTPCRDCQPATQPCKTCGGEPYAPQKLKPFNVWARVPCRDCQPATQPCETCGGSGNTPYAAIPVKCRYCLGSGRVPVRPEEKS